MLWSLSFRINRIDSLLKSLGKQIYNLKNSDLTDEQHAYWIDVRDDYEHFVNKSFLDFKIRICEK